MLKGVDPLLTPELLKIMAEMGHGDELIVADANFTAASLARAGGQAIVRVPCTTVQRVTEAIQIGRATRLNSSHSQQSRMPSSA